MKKTQCVPLKEDHAMSRENKQERDNMQKSTVDCSTAETSVAQYNESVELATQFKIKLSSEFQSNNEVRTESCDKDAASDETKINTSNTKKKNKKNKVENKTKVIGANVENILNENQQYRKDRREELKSNIMKKTKQAKKMSKRKYVFSDYISVPEMKKILEEQTSDNARYIKGNLRVNPTFPKFAYLRMEDTEERDLLIIGIQYRNRAFDGDLVVASINPEDLWFTFPDGKIQKTGTIVCILEALHPRTAVGHLKKQNSLVICYPRDQRIPMITILPESLPSLCLEQPDSYENTMFYVKIDSWEQSYPSGRILSIVGENGEIEAELQAILLENNLDVSPYQEELLEGLPDNDILTDDDIKDREDWRNECVFSIDPAMAVDIDDLLSCKVLENGNYEIGVHISDVTHYLKFSSLLDLEVSKRTTSVYMPHMVYHMLPEKLCQICSLYAGKDRLAFSIIWEMTPDAEVVKHRFAKTIVRSCYQMSYDLAQSMIENPEKFGAEDLDIKGNYTVSILCDVVNKLFKLSSKMRKKRFDSGALRLDKPKLQISFDATLSRENKIPTATNYYIYENKDSHRLIEEFMLLANMTTAIRLHTAIPETALLRIHRNPFKHSLNLLCETLRKYGIHLNIETAGTLHASVSRYEPDSYFANDPMKYITMVIVSLCSKTMQRAEYVCVSSIPSSCDTKHYALNVPFYTHFTSPIRRYPDCIVHNLLSAILEDKPLPEKWTAELCSKIAANCNVKKYNAKIVQEQSTELFFAQMIGVTGSFVTMAIVSNVKEDNIDVILSNTGIKLKIDLKEIEHTATIEYSVDYAMPTLAVNWKRPPIKQVINLFSLVHVRVEKIDKTLRLKATLLRSN